MRLQLNSQGAQPLEYVRAIVASFACLALTGISVSALEQQRPSKTALASNAQTVDVPAPVLAAFSIRYLLQRDREDLTEREREVFQDQLEALILRLGKDKSRLAIEALVDLKSLYVGEATGAILTCEIEKVGVAARAPIIRANKRSTTACLLMQSAVSPLEPQPLGTTQDQKRIEVCHDIETYRRQLMDLLKSLERGEHPSCGS